MDDPMPWVVEAFDSLGLPVEVPGPADTHGDLVIALWNTTLALDLKRHALVSEDVARRIATRSRDRDLETPEPDSEHRITFIVADRVTNDARRTLSDAGVGYLDLRGHVGLRSRGVLIDSEVDLGWVRPERADALAGRVGLEVATALLMQPDRGPAIRELARELNRSSSTVSEVLARLRRTHRITAQQRVVDERLFWDVVDRWPARRTYLAELPSPGHHTRLARPLQLGMSDVERSSGWALTDTVAAAAFDAPVALRADQPLDFFVPAASIIRRAQTLLCSAASPSTAACTVRVAPVPAVCDRRVDAPHHYFEWPIAHPVFIALDLARDAGRGREILSQWEPGGRWSRVW